MASTETLQTNLQNLAENPYPGRGLVLGLNQVGDLALQAYWVMGRSENSRNRLLVEEDDVVKTVPFDASKVSDPSLIIYNAMRQVRDVHFVSNGDQTDTAADYLGREQSFVEAMKSRTFEPDAPNFTPRITGYIHAAETVSEGPAWGISVIRKARVSKRLAIRDFFSDQLTQRGIGRTVHTYKGDGDPLPSFTGTPISLPTGEDVKDTAEMYWEHLDADNRVAIAVKGIHLATKETSYHIINALG